MTFKELLALGRLEGPGATSQAYRPRLALEFNLPTSNTAEIYLNNKPGSNCDCKGDSGMPFIFTPKTN